MKLMILLGRHDVWPQLVGIRVVGIRVVGIRGVLQICPRQ
jgi:hypothetical protein